MTYMCKYNDMLYLFNYVSMVASFSPEKAFFYNYFTIIYTEKGTHIKGGNCKYEGSRFNTNFYSRYDQYDPRTYS